jgi:NTP pyrophosphatase (non-canonical NTP hydrolase)
MKSNPLYEEFVSAGTLPETELEAKFLVGMGIAGEGGEVCDLLKKHLLHKKPLDREKLVAELGDVLWYIQLGCNVFDISVDEIVEYNIKKLCARYPDHYGDTARWIERAEGEQKRSLDEAPNLHDVVLKHHTKNTP